MMSHRIGQRGGAAIVHVGRGQRDVAQGGDPEAAEVCAVRKLWSGVACNALALADEELQAALRSERIPRHRGSIAPLERVAKIVEWRAAGDQRFLIRG